jgi:putative flavoprotein involved in K+ transport
MRNGILSYDTIVIGGGQAGLATSYYLTQAGREHVVLEGAAQPANAWRNGRWDSFKLVTPNWTLRMPGAEYNGDDREGFMPRNEIVAYFEQYVEKFHIPIQYNTRVIAVEPIDSRGYRVQTDGRSFEANNVVMATGFEQLPNLPSFASDLSPDITQLHSGAYRNPESLPPGAVLVVGSAQSGSQIAEELYLRGQKVYICIGGAGRVPRRYRAKDIVEWLLLTGFFNLTPDKLPVPREHFAPPHVSGANGGHTLNLHQFARDGVTLLGPLRGAVGDKVLLTPDLHENLAKADGFELQVQKMVDSYIQANGLDAPTEELPQLRDGYEQPIVEELNLKAAGINTVIWATGYTFDFSLVKLPIGDKDGFPIQTRGVANYPGLYFVGMPWMPSLKSGTLAGVAESAAHIASVIAEGAYR